MSDYKEIVVRWEDHHEGHGATEPTPREKLTHVLLETRGYLIQENEEMVEVCRDKYLDGSQQVGAPVRIMKKCVVYRSDTD